MRGSRERSTVLSDMQGHANRPCRCLLSVLSDSLEPLVLEVIGIKELCDDTDRNIDRADDRVRVGHVKENLAGHGEDRTGDEDAERMPPKDRQRMIG